MTDQQQDHSPMFSEAPASWNVKYTLNGFECMLTVRANSGKELMPKTREIIAWLIEIEATPGKPQPNGHLPPQPAAPAPATDEGASYETIQVASVAHVVSEKGHHSLKVKGGKYSKFGVTAWEEVIPVEGWIDWQIGQEFKPPDGMQFAVVHDGKKVTAFRKVAQP